MDQGGLLTADEGARALDHADLERDVGAQDPFTQQPQLPRLAQGDHQVLDRQRVLGADVDHAAAGAGAHSADQHPLDHAVGRPLEDAAIHVSARISLVSVADEYLVVPRATGEHLPLAAGEEAGPAAAAQASGLDLFDQPVRIALGQDLGQRVVPPSLDIIVDADRIDALRAREERALLGGEEGDLVLTGDPLPCVGIDVEQLLDHLTSGHRLDDARHLLRIDLGVEGAGGLDQQRRLKLAPSVAAGDTQVDLLRPAASDQLPLGDADQVVGAAGLTAGPGGYHDGGRVVPALDDAFPQRSELINGF